MPPGLAAGVAAAVVRNGWRLLHPAFNELMDRSPDRETIDEIQKFAAMIPDVDGVEKCFVRKMGYQFFVDMHVEMNPQMTALRPHGIAHEVKDNVRAAMPNVHGVLVQIEPHGPDPQ